MKSFGIPLLAGVMLAVSSSNVRADLGVAWLTQYGTSTTDQAQAIVVDSFGQSWVTGITSGNLDGVNAGGSDVLLTRLSSTGSIDFTRQRGGASGDFGRGIALVGSGGVFVGGSSNTAFDAQTLIGGNDALTLRFDTSGAWQTTTFAGSSSDDQINAVAGNATHLAEVGTAGASFDGQTFAGSTDAFIQRRDNTGAVVWTRFVGTNAADTGSGTTFDSAGNQYLAGQTAGSLPGFVIAGGGDMFVAKFDVNGNQTLLKQYGSSGTDGARGVEVDAGGNIYLTGFTGGSLGGQTNGGSADAFVTKFDSSGNALWSRLLGGSGFDQANAIDVDASGNVWIAGQTPSSFGDHINAGGNDAFVAKYDSSGNLLDTLFFSGTGGDQIHGLSIGPDGYAYVSGSTTSSLSGANAGSSDIFVAHLALPEPTTATMLSVVAASLLFRRRGRGGEWKRKHHSLFI